jgi:hypothetical protein
VEVQAATMALVTIVGSGGEWSGAHGRCSSSRVMQALCHALMHFRLASVRRPYIVLRCSGNNASIQQLAGLLRHSHAQVRGECACRLFVHGTCCCAGSQSSKVWLHWLHTPRARRRLCCVVRRDVERGQGVCCKAFVASCSVCCKLQGVCASRHRPPAREKALLLEALC